MLYPKYVVGKRRNYLLTRDVWAWLLGHGKSQMTPWERLAVDVEGFKYRITII